MKESTILNTRGENNALTIISDFTWSYSNYFCFYGDLSFFILGGSHRKVVLNKEGTMNEKVNGWSQSIKNLMYIMKLNIAGKFHIHNLLLLYFFRIIELPILWIPSTDYIYVRFSSNKTPFCFQCTAMHSAHLKLPKIPEKALPEVSPHQDKLFTSLTFRSLWYTISWEEQRNRKTSEAWRA